MSNKLHDFDDNDTEGRKPIVAQILRIKEQWKDVQTKIINAEKGIYITEVEKVEKPKKVNNSAVTELKSSLAQINPNISKLKKKIAEQTTSKRLQGWIDELGQLQAIKNDILKQLRNYEGA